MRVVNRTELAEFFEVSMPTIDVWIRRGCPYQQQGARGIAWKFDLLAVITWKLQAKPSTTPERMSPADRRAWYESEKKRLEVQAMAARMVPADEIDQGIITALKSIGHALRKIPASLEQKGIDTALAQLVGGELQAAYEGMAARLGFGCHERA